ncbi:MAG: N-acetylmuramoyl-L-alanine amidase [Planctomycetes bacterium]|nr:N-acetylmuramoyl-L-alanine amidase [Planctomycetota bacterium]MCB9884944.1 N-acetylmuramoyl-L-alanine amidase [Planctomycetota bacterium]
MNFTHRHHRLVAGLLIAAAFALLVRCVSTPRRVDDHDNRPSPTRTPDSIVASGAYFPIGTPVVLWQDPDGYDAYRREKFFTKEDVPDGKLRYAPLRGNLPDAIAANAAAYGELSLEELRQVVHQFVIHFDVCCTSRQCFKILQDKRCLSVHFMLDVDGTIYQTLDLREKAWHATIANDFSVGVEIAHPGAYPQPMNADMRRFYEKDEFGYKAKFPAWLEYGVRTPNFVARPDRPDIIDGEIQGKRYYQLDFTPQQYEALAHLCAGLNRVFPRIRLDAPRDPDGEVRTAALPEEELRAFDGIVGHFHVQTNKNDPGPAFQWERVLRQARALRAQPE